MKIREFWEKNRGDVCTYSGLLMMSICTMFEKDLLNIKLLYLLLMVLYIVIYTMFRQNIKKSLKDYKEAMKSSTDWMKKYFDNERELFEYRMKQTVTNKTDLNL